MKKRLLVSVLLGFIIFQSNTAYAQIRGYECFDKSELVKKVDDTTYVCYKKKSVFWEPHFSVIRLEQNNHKPYSYVSIRREGNLKIVHVGEAPNSHILGVNIAKLSPGAR